MNCYINHLLLDITILNDKNNEMLKRNVIFMTLFDLALCLIKISMLEQKLDTNCLPYQTLF